MRDTLWHLVTPCDTLWHLRGSRMIVIPRRAPGAVHDPREKAMSKKRRTGTAEFHTQPLKRRISGILSLRIKPGVSPNCQKPRVLDRMCKEKGFIYTNTLVFYTKTIFFPWQATFFTGFDGLRSQNQKPGLRSNLRFSTAPIVLSIMGYEGI